MVELLSEPPIWRVQILSQERSQDLSTGTGPVARPPETDSAKLVRYLRWPRPPDCDLPGDFLQVQHLF